MQLRRWAVDVAGQPGAVVLREPPPGGWPATEQATPSPGERVIFALPDLVDALEEYLEPVDGEEPDRAWSGRTQGGTISAFMRRLYAASHRLGHLIRAGQSRRIDRTAAQVTVVGIQSLHDLGQRFVVGALLQETFEEKEQTGQRLPLSVIVLDELNKYAPREGHSPLKDMLIDIAQRGRSLGVLLVGAQQTASRVAPEVLENAALRVAGRLDAAEAERSEYGWMLPSTRARARLLKPGTMVVSQPAIPVPLVLTFPFPAWATRREEVGDDGRSFRGLVMRVLHTSDWHIGKRIGRFDRSHEFREVLEEVADIADREQVDLVLHSGDVFDRPVPPVEALSLGLQGLVRLTDGGRRPVVAIAGNHDSPGLFEALAPFVADRNVHLVGEIKAPELMAECSSSRLRRGGRS